MTASIAGPGVSHVFLRDMLLMASIGVYKHEQTTPQRVRINVDLAVHDGGDTEDRLDRVVNYAVVADAVRAIVAAGHIKLVETLAERIAAACLLDAKVLCARVRVEKLDVFADMVSAGVEVERCRSSTGPA